MADRGRDLKISILSDTDRFDLEKPAQELEELSQNTKDAGDDLEKFARDAKTTAGKVDDAFDAIARSSKSSIRTKVSDDVNTAKKKLHEVKEEAHQTARESFASFSGGGSLTDAAQEIAANVPALFGPVGLAIGGLLSAGIFKFISDFQAAKERIRETASELTGALIETKGKIDEAFVNDKIKEFAQDGSILEIRDQALAAGIGVDDFVRALAGDEDALKRVQAQLGINSAELNKHKGMTQRLSQAENNQAAAISTVRGRLGEQATAYGIAKQAANAAREAAETPVNPRFNGTQSMAQARAYNAELDKIARSVTTTVHVNLPYTALGHFKRELQQIQSGRYYP